MTTDSKDAASTSTFPKIQIIERKRRGHSVLDFREQNRTIEGEQPVMLEQKQEECFNIQISPNFKKQKNNTYDISIKLAKKYPQYVKLSRQLKISQGVISHKQHSQHSIKDIPATPEPPQQITSGPDELQLVNEESLLRAESPTQQQIDMVMKEPLPSKQSPFINKAASFKIEISNFDKSTRKSAQFSKQKAKKGQNQDLVLSSKDLKIKKAPSNKRQSPQESQESGRKDPGVMVKTSSIFEQSADLPSRSRSQSPDSPPFGLQTSHYYQSKEQKEEEEQQLNNYGFLLGNMRARTPNTGLGARTRIHPLPSAQHRSNPLDILQNENRGVDAAFFKNNFSLIANHQMVSSPSALTALLSRSDLRLNQSHQAQISVPTGSHQEQASNQPQSSKNVTTVFQQIDPKSRLSEEQKRLLSPNGTTKSEKQICQNLINNFKNYYDYQRESALDNTVSFSKDINSDYNAQQQIFELGNQSGYLHPEMSVQRIPDVETEAQRKKALIDQIKKDFTEIKQERALQRQRSMNQDFIIRNSMKSQPVMPRPTNVDLFHQFLQIEKQMEQDDFDPHEENQEEKERRRIKEKSVKLQRSFIQNHLKFNRIFGSEIDGGTSLDDSNIVQSRDSHWPRKDVSFQLANQGLDSLGKSSRALSNKLRADDQESMLTSMFSHSVNQFAKPSRAQHQFSSLGNHLMPNTSLAVSSKSLPRRKISRNAGAQTQDGGKQMQPSSKLSTSGSNFIADTIIKQLKVRIDKTGGGMVDVQPGKRKSSITAMSSQAIKRPTGGAISSPAKTRGLQQQTQDSIKRPVSEHMRKRVNRVVINTRTGSLTRIQEPTEQKRPRTSQNLLQRARRSKQLSNLNVTKKKVADRVETSDPSSEDRTTRFKPIHQIDVLSSSKDGKKSNVNVNVKIVNHQDSSYRTSKTMKREGEDPYKTGKMTPLIREDQLLDSDLQISIDQKEHQRPPGVKPPVSIHALNLHKIHSLQIQNTSQGFNMQTEHTGQTAPKSPAKSPTGGQQQKGLLVKRKSKPRFRNSIMQQPSKKMFTPIFRKEQNPVQQRYRSQESFQASKRGSTYTDGTREAQPITHSSQCGIDQSKEAIPGHQKQVAKMQKAFGVSPLEQDNEQIDLNITKLKMAIYERSKANSRVRSPSKGSDDLAPPKPKKKTKYQNMTLEQLKQWQQIMEAIKISSKFRTSLRQQHLQKVQKQKVSHAILDLMREKTAALKERRISTMINQRIQEKVFKFTADSMAQASQITAQSEEEIEERKFIRDTFKDIFSGEFKISQRKRTKAQEKKEMDRILRKIAKQDRRSNILSRFRNAVFKVSEEIQMNKGAEFKYKPTLEQKFQEMLQPKSKQRRWQESLGSFFIQSFGIQMQEMIYDLMKNVIVDSSNLHRVLSLAKLSNYQYNFSDPEVVQSVLKKCNLVQLIQGYPTYFSLDISLLDLLEDRTKIFPIKFKVFRKLTKEQQEQARRQSEKVSFQNNDEAKRFMAILSSVNVYISPSVRLPTSQNCAKHVKGIDKIFSFGPKPWYEELLKEAKQKKLQKLYLSFQYGSIEGDLGLDPRKKQATMESASLQFHLLIYLSQKLSGEQIKQMKVERQRQKFQEISSFRVMKAMFPQPFDQMGRAEREKFLEMQNKLIDKDLKKFYIENHHVDPDKQIVVRKNKYGEIMDGVEEEQEESSESDDLNSSSFANIQPAAQSSKVFNKATFEALRLQALLKEADLDAEILDSIFELPRNTSMIRKNIRLAFDPKFSLNQKRLVEQIFGKDMSPLQIIKKINSKQMKLLTEEYSLKFSKKLDEMSRHQNRVGKLKELQDKLKQQTLGKASQLKLPLEESRRPGQSSFSSTFDASRDRGGTLQMMGDQTIKISTEDGALFVLSSSGSDSEHEGSKRMNKVSFVLKPSEDDILKQKIKKKFSSEVRETANKNRRVIADQLLKMSSEQRKKHNLKDNQTKATEKRVAQELEKRRQNEENFVRWAKYRVDRDDARVAFFNIMKKQAHLRHFLCFVHIQRVYLYMWQCTCAIKDRIRKKLIMLATAHRFKFRYQKHFCRYMGPTLEIRLQKKLQQSLALISANAVQEQLLIRSRIILKQFFSECSQFNRLVRNIKHFHAKIIYVQRRFKNARRNRVERRQLLMFMFFRALKFLFLFYKDKAQLVKGMLYQQSHTGPMGHVFMQNPMLHLADGSTVYTQEDMKNYNDINTKLKCFYKAYSQKARKELIHMLEDEGLLSEESSSSSSESSFSSDDETDTKETRRGRFDKSTKNLAERLAKKEIKKQRRYDESKEVVQELLETVIDEKILQYSIEFMLWRYKHYEHLMMCGPPIHDKMGDLNQRRQEIRLRLPGCRDHLEILTEKIFGGTEQVFKDRTSSEDFMLNKKEENAIMHGQSTAKLGRRGTKIQKLKKRPSILISAQPSSQPPRLKPKTSIVKSAMLVSHIDKIVEYRLNEIDSNQEQHSFQQGTFQHFIFVVNREEIHRLVFKAIHLYWDKIGGDKEKEKSKKKKRKLVLKRQSTRAADATDSDSQ